MTSKNPSIAERPEAPGDASAERILPPSLLRFTGDADRPLSDKDIARVTGETGGQSVAILRGLLDNYRKGGVDPKFFRTVTIQFHRAQEYLAAQTRGDRADVVEQFRSALVAVLCPADSAAPEFDPKQFPNLGKCLQYAERACRAFFGEDHANDLVEVFATLATRVTNEPDYTDVQQWGPMMMDVAGALLAHREGRYAEGERYAMDACEKNEDAFDFKRSPMSGFFFPKTEWRISGGSL